MVNQAYKRALEIIHTKKIEALYDNFFPKKKNIDAVTFVFFVEKRPYRDYRNLRLKQIHSNIRYLFFGLYNVNKPLCDSLSTEIL